MSNVPTLPAAFPLHEDRNFISESEWVIFKLLCKPLHSFIHENAQELSTATGQQVSVERCDILIRTVRISQLDGLGSWISRLFAEAGLSDHDVCQQPAAHIIGAVNRKTKYPLCNEATMHALQELQLQWKSATALAEQP